jgi:hypothetical protein
MTFKFLNSMTLRVSSERPERYVCEYFYPLPQLSTQHPSQKDRLAKCTIRTVIRLNIADLRKSRATGVPFSPIFVQRPLKRRLLGLAAPSYDTTTQAHISLAISQSLSTTRSLKNTVSCRRHRAAEETPDALYRSYGIFFATQPLYFSTVST